MLCPTCHHSFFALVICDDGVHRCFSCKTQQPKPGLTRSRFFKHLRRRDGLCITCGAEAAPGEHYCARHVAENARRRAQQMEGLK